MAQRWRVRVGTTVRYRDAADRVFHAIVTAVTNQTTIDLRIGNGATKGTAAGATRTAVETPATPGWYRHGSDF